MQNKITSKQIMLLALLVALAFFGLASGTWAKGPPEKVTIVGPDWFGEIKVTDPALLEHLGLAAFEDVESPVDTMEALDRGYLLSRGSLDGEEFQPWDRVLYFPSPSGGRGYVYYLEIVNGSGPYDGKWYYISEDGEAAIQEVFQNHSVRWPDKSQVSDPQSAANDPTQLRAWPLTLVGGLLVGWLLGRRQ